MFLFYLFCLCFTVTQMFFFLLLLDFFRFYAESRGHRKWGGGGRVILDRTVVSDWIFNVPNYSTKYVHTKEKSNLKQDNC